MGEFCAREAHDVPVSNANAGVRALLLLSLPTTQGAMCSKIPMRHAVRAGASMCGERGPIIEITHVYHIINQGFLSHSSDGEMMMVEWRSVCVWEGGTHGKKARP